MTGTRHNRRRRRGRFSFLWKLLAALIIVAAMVAAVTLFFRMDYVVVTGNERYTEQEVLDASGLETGSNLYFINKFDVKEAIFAQLPYVEEIRICSSGLTARVYLREGSGENKLPEESEAVSTTPTCCTGNRILDHYYASGRQLRHLEPFSWKADWISALSEDAERPENFPLYAATHSVHGCSLLCGGIIQFRCEDIGRHNALDKAIGYALIEGIDLSRSALFTTGRVPTDMALKAIRAGVPVLSARKAPTAEAVKLAGEYGLAILQTGKQGLVKIWSGGRTCDRSIGIKALNRSTRIKI